MKCPKCHYLGFETGDRCKNCGYDFSLLSMAESQPSDYEIHPSPIDDVPVRFVEHTGPEDDPWIGMPIEEPSLELGIQFAKPNEVSEAVADLPLTAPTVTGTPAEAPRLPDTPVDITVPPKPVAPFLSAMSAGPALPGDRALPLFKRAHETDDEPLIKMPAVPRAPLSVRRTPDAPRLRPVPLPVSRSAAPPELQFSDDAGEGIAPPPDQDVVRAQRVPQPSFSIVESSHPVARMAAALIDYAILFGIDAAVVYFTVRMAGLSMNDWTTLPAAPLATFLGLLMVSYFSVFTAVGGQTIGKMALGMCVVDDDGKRVDPARALRRTSATILSFLLLGLGFIPGLFGEYRALHDRLAGTRVVRLRSV